MGDKVSKFLRWIVTFFSGSEDASMKRLAYFIAVVSSVVWLSLDLQSHGLTEIWKEAFVSFIGFITGGYVGGKGLDVVYNVLNKTPVPTTPIEPNTVKEDLRG